MADSTDGQRLLRWWPLIALALTLAVILLGFGSRAAESSAESRGANGFPDRGELLAPTPPPKGSEVVHLGIEPLSYDDVDPSLQAFKTSFYIWWRWKGKIDPVPTTDIINSAVADTHYVVNYSYVNGAGREEPTKLPDGSFYQTARISTGIVAPFPVNRYPIDAQNLLIRFENNTYTNQQVVYVPDRANMTRDPEIEVSGWQVKGADIYTKLHQYGTNFGAVGQGVAASQYSQLIYNVRIQRPVSHFVIKLLLPMLVILTAAMAALLVKEDKFDVRLVMVGTGLLTLILLQGAYGPDLPATAPGVLMDKIYLVAYLVLGATFVRVIYTANQIHHHERDRHSYIRGDRILGGALWVGALVATGVLIAL